MRGGFLLFCFLLLTGCKLLDRAPGASRLAAAHRSVAILPPLVQLPDTTGFTYAPGEVSAIFQGGLYDWLDARRAVYAADFTVQDPDATNDRLEAAGYYDGQALSYPELLGLLQTDALLVSTLTFDGPKGKPLLGPARPVTRLRADIQLFDRQTQSFVWRYTPRRRLWFGTPPLPVLDRVAQQGTLFLPYFR